MRISGGVTYSVLRRCQSETEPTIPLATLFNTGPNKMNTYRVDPEPGAVAASGRTGWHPFWDLEVREAGPDAGLVDAEYREVFWLNLGHI